MAGQGKGAQFSPAEVAWSRTTLKHRHPTPPRRSHARAARVQVDNMTNIFNEYKHRVAECFDEGRSQGVVECNKLVDQLHEAMQHAPIVDQRLSVAGEKHRILTRAFAMREVLLIQDPTLAHLFAQEGILQPEEVKEKPKCHITMSRSSNEATPDATPSQCVLSVCLLLAALYEQTPWGEGSDLRRQVYHDFTILKRDFRKDQLMCLKGRTGTTEELFNAVKEVDRTQGLDNILGVLFDDWKVYSNRVDPFILADIDVQVRSNRLDLTQLCRTTHSPGSAQTAHGIFAGLQRLGRPLWCDSLYAAHTVAPSLTPCVCVCVCRC